MINEATRTMDVQLERLWRRYFMWMESKSHCATPSELFVLIYDERQLQNCRRGSHRRCTASLLL